MLDIIKLLPDSVANQIAAGEVIQRPASVVKELVENALDAEATLITVIIKDAGKTLIQVIDNGKGMTETDARMAFERHATSKITEAADLFNIHTKGFRGEALASVAAIAHVELKTKQHNSELGTLLDIRGSKVERQEPVSCSPGSNLSVKNLFYNVPARRKFLKSQATEFRHILNEFHRIALVAPQVTFKLYHNEEEVLDLVPGNTRQRIVGIFGKALNQKLVSVEVDTSLVQITGFIGKPEFARKKFGEQYFFANSRYMRHPYFHKAVMDGYGNILQQETFPSYFLYLNVDPGSLDVNIHPTKTEIKFENEQAIWPIIMAAVREALGKFNVVPSIDFDQEGAIDIPIIRSDTEIRMPVVETNPDYNPFKQTRQSPVPSGSKPVPADWEKLYHDFEGERTNPEADIAVNPVKTADKDVKDENGLFGEEESYNTAGKNLFQYKNRYILTSVKSGLLLIDQHRAHSRILFEKYLANIENKRVASQKLLFPETIELSADEVVVVEGIKEVLSCLGFDVERFGKNTFAINGVPYDTGSLNAVSLLEQLIETAASEGKNVKQDLSESLAKICAKAAAIQYGKPLNGAEMQNIVDSLFACSLPNYSPDGRLVLTIITDNDLEKHLK